MTSTIITKGMNKLSLNSSGGPSDGDYIRYLDYDELEEKFQVHKYYPKFIHNELPTPDLKEMIADKPIYAKANDHLTKEQKREQIRELKKEYMREQKKRREQEKRQLQAFDQRRLVSEGMHSKMGATMHCNDRQQPNQEHEVDNTARCPVYSRMSGAVGRSTQEKNVADRLRKASSARRDDDSLMADQATVKGHDTMNGYANDGHGAAGHPESTGHSRSHSKHEMVFRNPFDSNQSTLIEHDPTTTATKTHRQNSIAGKFMSFLRGRLDDESADENKLVPSKSYDQTKSTMTTTRKVPKPHGLKTKINELTGRRYTDQLGMYFFLRCTIRRGSAFTLRTG